MKRGLIFIIVFVILFLSGCKNTQDNINANTNSTEIEISQSMHIAEENTTQSETKIITQPTTETTSNIVYDFDWWYLKRVIIDGKTVVENDYDSDGMRVVKRGAEECRFTYDENKNLVREERNGKVITYFYKEDEEYQYWHIIGFSYEETNYYYTRDDLSRINGIQDENGELVAKYEYSLGNNRVEKVMKKRGEEWICTEDIEFIGNVNTIRNRGAYYDVESDLYYGNNGVFFSPITGNIIWNVDKSRSIY